MPISDYMRQLREKIGHMPIMATAVTALVFDEWDRVLLHRASEDGKWHTVGGSIDPHEQPADAAVRETLEETGVLVEPTRVVGVYTDPPAIYSNGDVVLYISIVFECRLIRGHPHPADDESVEVGFFAADALPELAAHDREKILRALRREPQAHFHLTPTPTGSGRR